MSISITDTLLPASHHYSVLWTPPPNKWPPAYSPLGEARQGYSGSWAKLSPTAEPGLVLLRRHPGSMENNRSPLTAARVPPCARDWSSSTAGPPPPPHPPHHPLWRSSTPSRQYHRLPGLSLCPPGLYCTMSSPRDPSMYSYTGRAAGGWRHMNGLYMSRTITSSNWASGICAGYKRRVWSLRSAASSASMQESLMELALQIGLSFLGCTMFERERCSYL